MPTSVAALLPGTGSDETFVREVFAGPLAAVGVRLIAPAPPRGADLVGGSLAALDAIAAESDGPILVGGVSFGAHVAAAWAVRQKRHCAGLLVALPAWNGEPGSAPASLAAKLSADLVAANGLEPALATSVDGVPRWLADELSRAWRGHGDSLADGLRAAADYPAPTLADLATVDVPAGIATCVDDPIHPTKVAYGWAGALPRAAVVETTLTALGEDRESLGRATVLALLRSVRQGDEPA
ncbi:alpha/beta fold hydrolase [Amycolatopsis sp. cg5]|uniref:alpha/beta fold hydrolase n=1 Tax=Amycolatopsis sp. cg5 TaxID=3238802 RepID=UPI0035266618